MSESKPQSRALRALRAGPLRGEFSPPGDRGLAARALMLAASAGGESRIVGFPDSSDTLHLIASLGALGALIEVESGVAYVQGLGIGGFLEPRQPLNFGGHGAAAALGMGLVGYYPFATTITGDPLIAARDFGHVLAPLRTMGIHADGEEGRFLPVRVRGPVTPVPLEVRLAEPSAVAKGSVLMAALCCPGITTVIKSAPTHQGLETVLAAFGAHVETNDLADGTRTVALTGLPDLRGRDMVIPADPGRSFYPLVAALVVPGSSILLQDVLAAPSRMGLIMTLIEMGADITLINRRLVDGLEVADLRVRHSTLNGVDVPSERAAAMVRDYPLLALAAAFATGTTTMAGLAPPEDWDRLAVLAAALTEAGATTVRSSDRVVVEGQGRLRGGVAVTTSRDPALTLAALTMGMAARDPVTIDDDSAASIAYPGFVERFESLGVRFSRVV